MSCKMIKTVAASSLMGCLLLNACGGGGGGGDAPASSSSSSIAVITTGVNADCTNCGAASNTSYSGSGVGVWTYNNTQSATVSLPVSISGLNGKNVTVVYTNQGSTAVAMPSIALAPDLQNGTSFASPADNLMVGDPAPAKMVTQREEFSRLFAGKAAPATSVQRQVSAAPATSWVIGDSRAIVTPMEGTSLTISLKKTVTTQDGTVVNLWVDNNEFGSGKLSMATLDTFASRYASGSNSIYTLVTGLIGKPWGAHGYNNLIPDGQSINIVFYNANNGGWGGYFSAGDEYTTTAYSKSNTWLSFYINSARLYDNNTNLTLYTNYYISVLAHEFTHMIHQYQRAVLMGKPFVTWLNELSAMSMEDIVASKVFTTTNYNTARDERFFGWINSGNFNCQQDDWLGLSTVNGCNSYDMNGAFGAFLNRQYGIAYYKALFASSATDSVQIMDGAIKSVGGPGYQDALRRWGDSIALLPAATTPAGHGYPARTDSGFSLAGFDGSVFKSYRKLPTTVPATLLPHGHFPVVRTNVSGTYSETLTIPANTSVTVVIQ